MPPVFWKKKTRKIEVANYTKFKKKKKKTFVLWHFSCIIFFPLQTHTCNWMILILFSVSLWSVTAKLSKRAKIKHSSGHSCCMESTALSSSFQHVIISSAKWIISVQVTQWVNTYSSTARNTLTLSFLKSPFEYVVFMNALSVLIYLTCLF